MSTFRATYVLDFDKAVKVVSEADAVTRLEVARLELLASYTPCLNPGVVIVDRRALDELLTAAHEITGGRAP